MKNSLLISGLFMASSLACVAQQNNVITIDIENASQTIPKEIYGQFSEHLGTCIYGGLWVGPDSDIPNKDGYRTDVLKALQGLKIAVMRCPGGCFADEYHWMDGIGPREDRPKMINTNWGGTVEDNSFGTHEFLIGRTALAFCIFWIDFKSLLLVFKALNEPKASAYITKCLPVYVPVCDLRHADTDLL